jgi:diguanylate cyclase (GGDEF)-like protein
MHVNDSGELLCFGGCPLAHSLKDGQTRESQVYLHHASGHRVPVAVRVVPIRAEADASGTAGEIIGAVEIFSENITLNSALARIEALQRIALLDPLTGIGNRRMILNRLDTVLEQWSKHNLTFGVLLIDIDHFKQVNDSYGHDIGDHVLKMVTSSLSYGLRSHDYIGRWGGEEFLAVVPEVSEPDLRAIAERLRMLVEQSIIFLDPSDRRKDRSVMVTVSLGGAVMKPGETLDSLIKCADRNMYACKEAGRNRVII